MPLEDRVEGGLVAPAGRRPGKIGERNARDGRRLQTGHRTVAVLGDDVGMNALGIDAEMLTQKEPEPCRVEDRPRPEDMARRQAREVGGDLGEDVDRVRRHQDHARSDWRDDPGHDVADHRRVFPSRSSRVWPGRWLLPR